MELQKKISFSFFKSARPANILNSKETEKKNDIELIDCLEGQSIKVKNAKDEAKAPLIIPLRDDSKNLLDRVRQSRRIKDNEQDIDQRPDSELTLDELAARQLTREATRELTTDSETKIHAVPLTGETQPNQNDKEPTLEDYNNVPINDFGMAVLRGMGWTESSGIGKNNKQATKVIEPELRPKGMGLGAQKMVNSKIKGIPSDKEKCEDLLVKGAFIKIIAGKYSGNYCEVLGLDDESGRIIVKTAIAQNVLSLNEFLLEPVSKEDYYKSAKVISTPRMIEDHQKKSSMEKLEQKSLSNIVYKPSTSSEGQQSKRRRKRYSSSSATDTDIKNGKIGKRKSSKHRRDDDRRRLKKKSKKHRKKEESKSRGKDSKKKRERNRSPSGNDSSTSDNSSRRKKKSR